MMEIYYFQFSIW